MHYGMTLTTEPIQGPDIPQGRGVDMLLYLMEELASWEGTPHRSRWQHKGKGVDCVRFVAAIASHLTGIYPKIKTLPQDTAFHNKSAAMSGLRELLKLFPTEPVRGTVIQPGDLVIAGPAAGGPGHGN